MASASQAVFGGRDDAPETPGNDDVVALPDDGCSGFLLTSVIGITAAHCDVQNGDQVDVGLNNPMYKHGAAGPPRAVRRIVDHLNYIPPSIAEATMPPVDVIARDVALFRFWPPITSDASPEKPSLETPALQPFELIPGLATATFAGGMSGYGHNGVDLDAGTYTDPKHRQVYVSNNLSLFHYGVNGDLAIWIISEKFGTGEGTLPGDSGGPLFTLEAASDSGFRNPIGVTSHWHSELYPAACDATGNLFCGPDTFSDTWADITAPAVKAWILRYVDPNNTGRWEGETDYRRNQFKPSGCTNKSCDPACHLTDDADCDFVNDDHDNCPGDYNPDQYNYDDGSADHYQALDPSDPGDACDLCWKVPGPIDQPDCNKDAEFLEWGHYRQPLTEQDVVGTNPRHPYPGISPLLAENRAHFKGDECDDAACTSVATEWNKVPAGIVQPGPLCQNLPKTSVCGFNSNSRVQHDGRILALLSGETGGTGYRYCPCNGPLNTHNDLRINCLMGTSAPCPWQASQFNSPSVHKLNTVNPSFGTLANGEQGTIEQFTSSAKPKPPAFDWRWWQDYNTIQGTSITFPIPYASIDSVKLDGLIWSNVRQQPDPFYHGPDLESYWHGVHLRLHEGVSPEYIATVLPSQWASPGCPSCPWGFHMPYVLAPDPAELPGRLFAGLPGGAIDMTSSADSFATEVFGAAATNPDLTLVSAAENGAYLDTLDEQVPMVAALDTSTLEAGAFLTQSASTGTLTAYSATPVNGFGDTLQKADVQSPCLAALGTADAPAKLDATLSATRKAVYMFAGSPGTPSAVLDYDIPTGECTRLVGPVAVDRGPVADPVGQPLGIVYNAVLRSLYAVDRKDPKRPVPLRILRIGLDGNVQVLAKIASPWTGNLYLATGQDGELVIGENHKRSDHFRVMIVSVRGDTPRTLARYTAKGSLVAAPMLDERGLYLALAGKNNQPTFAVMARGDLEHRKSSLEWVFR